MPFKTWWTKVVKKCVLYYDILSFILLFQDGGYQFMIKGEPRCFAGTIAYVSGDNLGSQLVGGFKQGSQSHRKCRVCMGTGAEISKCVCIRNFISQFQIVNARYIL